MYTYIIPSTFDKSSTIYLIDLTFTYVIFPQFLIRVPQNLVRVGASVISSHRKSTSVPALASLQEAIVNKVIKDDFINLFLTLHSCNLTSSFKV